MRYFALLAAVSTMAFMSDTVETVIVTGSDGNPLRINKADHNEEVHGPVDDEATANIAAGRPAVSMPLPDGLLMQAAPSAPNFKGDPAVTPPPLKDPKKDAVMPTMPSPGAFLVFKDGKKYFVVTASGDKVKDHAGIENAGYDTEQAAWDAINAAPK